MALMEPPQAHLHRMCQNLGLYKTEEDEEWDTFMVGHIGYYYY